MIISGQTEETDEEKLPPIMVDEPQSSEESFLSLRLRESWVELEGMMPGEAGEEVVEALPEPLLEEVLKGGDHEAGDAFARVGHEEEVLETVPEVGEGADMQLEAEDINEEPPSTTVMAKAGPFLGASHIVPTSVAPALVKAGQTPSGFAHYWSKLLGS